MKRAGEFRSDEFLQKKKVAPIGVKPRSLLIAFSFSVTVPATAVFPYPIGACTHTIPFF